MKDIFSRIIWPFNSSVYKAKKGKDDGRVKGERIDVERSTSDNLTLIVVFSSRGLLT